MTTTKDLNALTQEYADKIKNACTTWEAWQADTSNENARENVMYKFSDLYSDISDLAKTQKALPAENEDPLIQMYSEDENNETNNKKAIAKELENLAAEILTLDTPASKLTGAVFITCAERIKFLDENKENANEANFIKFCEGIYNIWSGNMEQEQSETHDKEINQDILTYEPVNAFSGNHYKGKNKDILLQAAIKLNGLSETRWCTFNQANAEGFRIKRGSHGTTIFSSTYKFVRVEGEAKPVRELITERYKVFHFSQVEEFNPELHAIPTVTIKAPENFQQEIQNIEVAQEIPF